MAYRERGGIRSYGKKLLEVNRMDIFNKSQIEKALNIPELILEIERGFMAFSEGKVVVPTVGHMDFDDPPGGLFIKYGHIPKDEYFVVKIVSLFPQNPQKGKSAISGMMLVFSQKTGEPVALLEDEGYLSTVRTAIAGAISAKYLAPSTVNTIGIIGTGEQARMQLQFLKEVIPCKKALVWGRREEGIKSLMNDPALGEFEISPAKSIVEIGEHCQIIVTTTSSTQPLLMASDIKKGTHITAVGSDEPGKQELDPAIFSKADLIVADSRQQCFAQGELSHLEQQSEKEKVLELGEVIATKVKRREDQISVVDLTGVAIQDIAIAIHCYQNLRKAKA